MLYLMMHSTHFIYGCMVRCFWLCRSKYSSLITCCCELVMKKRKEGRKEGKALFNDAVNTFYLWLDSKMFLVMSVKIQQLDNMLLWICDEKRKEGRKEGNALFNDALNTFYLWLYGVWYTVRCFWLGPKYSRLTTCCEFVMKKGRKEGRKEERKCFI